MASLESQPMTSLQNKISLETETTNGLPANFSLEKYHGLTALAWLACLLRPALAWSGLGRSRLPCLSCLGLVQQQQQRLHRRPPLVLLDQAKARQARKARQAQARPSQSRI